VPSALDHQLFVFFNGDRGWPAYDLWMAVFSSFSFWLPFFILAGLLLLVLGGFRARAMLVCLLLSVAVMESVVVNPLKNLIGRPRPNNVLAEARSVKLASVTPRFFALTQPLRIQPPRISVPPKPGKSLPSGHTANMFCFATMLAAFYGWRGALFFLPAALVAISRVATASHWFSDILLSAALSIVVTLGLLALYSLIWRRLAPRLVPRLAARHPRLITPP